MVDGIVEAQGVRKRFGPTDVLRGVSLRVGAGEVVALIGPSGSGKSTFLRCINHLERIDGGLLLVEGKPVGYTRSGNTLRESSVGEIASRRARIGMVFQTFNLFAHKTALENVIEGPVVVKRESRRQAREFGLHLLERVGLAHKASHHRAALSGGQQQRVAIARALAMRPAIMLFDEPTSALDPGTVGEVLDVIADIASGGLTTMIVTHEMAFARQLSSRVAVLSQGAVVEEGPSSEVFGHPRHAVTRAMMSRGA